MGNETLYCSCGQDFDERPLLETHKKNCSTIRKLEEDEKDQGLKENKAPKVGQFNCDKCGKSFGTAKSLTSHENQSTNVTSVTEFSRPPIVLGPTISMCIQRTCLNVTFVATLLKPTALINVIKSFTQEKNPFHARSVVKDSIRKAT